MTDFKTSDRDVNRAIRSWLHEDRHEDASRIAGAVLDQVEAAPGRRAGWPAWRTPNMNRFMTIGLGAAAVVVIGVLLGAQLFGSPSGGTGHGGPSETALAIPSPTQLPPSGSSDAALTPGPFLWIPRDVPQDPLAITVDIPADGWTKDSEFGALTKGEFGDLPESAMLGGALLEPIYVYGDPCDWKSSMPDSPATTVDEIVAALATQASRQASDPQDVTIGGYPGKKITLRVPEDAQFEQCDDRIFASFGFGDTRDQLWLYHQGPGQVDELWFVDVDGVIVVIDAKRRADTPLANFFEMREIAESATFE